MRIFSGFLSIWLRNYLWSLAIIVGCLLASHQLGLGIRWIWENFFDWSPGPLVKGARDWLEKWPFLGYRSPTYLSVVLIFALFHFTLIYRFRMLFKNSAFRRTQVRYYAMLTGLGFLFELISFGLRTWTFPPETHFKAWETFIPFFGHIFDVIVPFEEILWIILVIPLFHYFNLWVDWCSHDIHFYLEPKEYRGIKEDRLVRIRKDFVGAYNIAGKPRGTYLILHRIEPKETASNPEQGIFSEYHVPPAPPEPEKGEDQQTWIGNLRDFDNRYTDKVIGMAHRHTNFPHVLFRAVDRIQLVFKMKLLQFIRTPSLELIVPACLAGVCVAIGSFAMYAGFTYEGLEVILEGAIISLALPLLYQPTDPEFFQLEGDITLYRGGPPSAFSRNSAPDKIPKGLIAFAFIIILPISMVAHYFSVIHSNWVYPTENKYFLEVFNLASIKGGFGEILFKNSKPMPVIEYFFYFFFSIFQFSAFALFLRALKYNVVFQLVFRRCEALRLKSRRIAKVLHVSLVILCVGFILASVLPALWDIWSGLPPKPDYNLYIIGSMAAVILYAQSTSPGFRGALRSGRHWLYILPMTAFLGGWEWLHVVHFQHWCYCLDNSYFPALYEIQNKFEGCQLGLSFSQPFGYLFTACVFPAFYYMFRDANVESESIGQRRSK